MKWTYWKPVAVSQTRIRLATLVSMVSYVLIEQSEGSRILAAISLVILMLILKGKPRL